MSDTQLNTNRKLRLEIESLRQQLEELKVNHKAELKVRDQNCQMYLDNTRQQLAECQTNERSSLAREKVLRDALSAEDEDAWILKETALAMPSNSTALDEALKQAKREEVLKIADAFEIVGGPRTSQLHKWAEELK